MSATFFTYEDDDDEEEDQDKDKKWEYKEKRGSPVESLSPSHQPYLKENGTPTRDSPPREAREQPAYRGDYRRRRSSGESLSPSYVDNGGNPGEFVPKTTQYLPPIDQPQYNDIKPEPDQQVYTGGEFPSNQPIEDAQFLQIDEVRSNPSMEYLEAQEERRETFFPERRVTYSPPSPPPKRDVRVVKRKVVAHHSPRGERFVVSIR